MYSFLLIKLNNINFYSYICGPINRFLAIYKCHNNHSILRPYKVHNIYRVQRLYDYEDCLLIKHFSKSICIIKLSYRQQRVYLCVLLFNFFAKPESAKTDENGHLKSEKHVCWHNGALSKPESTLHWFQLNCQGTRIVLEV